MLSMGVYGVVLAGWASANNFALLGGQRAAALMISAEVAIGASIMGVCMVYGSLDLQEIARGQGAYWGGVIPKWGILTQPLGFVLFLIAGIATTKRAPFDFPEGESEIIGYNVEYSGMKFGMFLMADFVETVVVAGMTTALFLGGVAGAVALRRGLPAAGRARAGPPPPGRRAPAGRRVRDEGRSPWSGS